MHPALLLVLVVPLLELWVFLQVSHAIGTGWAVSLVIAAAIAGVVLIRRSGRKALVALNRSVATGSTPGAAAPGGFSPDGLGGLGRDSLHSTVIDEDGTVNATPARELGNAAVTFIGGLLLVLPGFLTDIVGLFCVLPPMRSLARALLMRILRRLNRNAILITDAAASSTTAQVIIEGETVVDRPNSHQPTKQSDWPPTQPDLRPRPDGQTGQSGPSGPTIIRGEIED